jgi:hypothetical protein
VENQVGELSSRHWVCLAFWGASPCQWNRLVAPSNFYLATLRLNCFSLAWPKVVGRNPLSQKEPELNISKVDIRAVYREGEDAVVLLVKSLLARIERAEARLDKLGN